MASSDPGYLEQKRFEDGLAPLLGSLLTSAIQACKSLFNQDYLKHTWSTMIISRIPAIIITVLLGLVLFASVAAGLMAGVGLLVCFAF